MSPRLPGNKIALSLFVLAITAPCAYEIVTGEEPAYDTPGYYQPTGQPMGTPADAGTGYPGMEEGYEGEYEQPGEVYPGYDSLEDEQGIPSFEVNPDGIEEGYDMEQEEEWQD